MPAQTDDDEGVFEVDGVFDADEVLRRELEQARTCYLRNKPNYFCILCRTRCNKKQIALSHLIPPFRAEMLHPINAAGQEAGPPGKNGSSDHLRGLKKHGYRGYCRRCEDMLCKKGEQHFNELMHEPLVRDNNSAVHVEGDEVGRVYHCALSVWWRLASLHSELACEKSSEGKKYRKLLESVRVWLHEPSRSLPIGLQVIFCAFHPDDLSHLPLDLHDAATKMYAGVMSDNGYITRVQMGPLHCLYMFMRLPVEISRSMHIDEGNAQLLRIPETNMVEHMWNIKLQMLQLEARASNSKRLSLEPPERVPSLDLIPPGTAVICDKIQFPYHRHIRTVVCSSNVGNICIDLYKPKQQKDEPPYQGVAFFSHQRWRVCACVAPVRFHWQNI